MEVLKRRDHQECLHCENKKRPTVEIVNLNGGDKVKVIPHGNEIVFMMEGELQFTFHDQAPKLLSEERFIFIPMGGVFCFSAVNRAKFIVIRLNEHISFCGGYRLEELYKQDDTALRGKKEEISALEINRSIKHFLQGLIETVEGDLEHCRYYFDLKVKELLALLISYYSPDELRDFFAPVLSPDVRFSEYVKEYSRRYRTIGELAGSMNISSKQFIKIFTRVFNMPPGKWLNEERAKMVYDELLDKTKTFKEIAYEQGFSSQQQFNRFCKRELGKNPGEIRKGEKDK